MKFKVSEDVDAPISIVWQHFTEFEGVEADARGRGVELSRAGNWTALATGVEWRGAATIRGKRRTINARVSALVDEDMYQIDSKIGGMECVYEMTFVPLSPTLTRVAAELDLSAKTLTARLFLQTMKLARGRVVQRLQGVLTRQGNAAEVAHRRANAG